MTADGKPIPTVSRRRKLVFRLAAVFVGLLCVGCVEGFFRLMGWGEINELDDPYIAFHDVKQLFVLDATGERYEIPKSRQVFFRPESFAKDKLDREFRIFCLGGSTVQGRPFAIETSLTTWLEITLGIADPSRKWEVINCGGVSYASYRLVPILKEVLNYQPDLIILYTGHNEFLEDRTYKEVKETSEFVASAHSICSNLRIYNALRSACCEQSSDRESRAVLPVEVDALLDYRGGLEKYKRDDAWRAGVIHHFESNVDRMIRIARRAGVPIVLCNPVSNLKDTPPFKMEFDRKLNSEQRAKAESLWKRAKASDDLKAARDLLEQAIAIDPRHPGLQFHLATCLYHLGETGAARGAFIKAKDEDICPLRMLEPMHQILRGLAKRHRIPFVDVDQLIANKCPHGIADDTMLVDHVHPSVFGHQLIADELFAELQRQGIADARDGWKEVRNEAYRKHLSSLPSLYFHVAKERLLGLKKWAAGRVTRVRGSK